MDSFKSVIIICSLLVAFVQCRNLPSFIKPCRKSDPNLEKCLINVMYSIKDKLATGIPELRLPPLDPLVVPFVKVDQGTKSVNFRATFKNITVYNGNEFTIKKIKINFDEPSISIHIILPKIRINSDYTINGKILLVPINGNGKSYGNFTNIDAQIFAKGKYLQKNNKHFLGLESRKLTFKIDDLWLQFDNLFNGKNKALADSTNKFINENWKEVIQEINPLIEDTVGEVIFSIIKGMLDLYAVEDLFLP